MATYVEHTACKVGDPDWCVKSFTEVFGVPIGLSLSKKLNREIWPHAGIRSNEDTTFNEKEGRLDRIVLTTVDYENISEKCFAWGYTVLPAGDNWLKMPNGTVIELKRRNSEILYTIVSQRSWVDQEREYTKISSCKWTK